jgi:hypothetical protein
MHARLGELLVRNNLITRQLSKALDEQKETEAMAAWVQEWFDQ